jgi:hypothetical protein
MQAYQREIDAYEKNPNFGFGQTLSDALKSKIEEVADAFVLHHDKEIRSTAAREDSLVSYGSRLSRFMKRIVQHVSGGKDKAIRLKADEELRKARSGLQNMMNNLEKRNIDFRSLISASHLFLEGLVGASNKIADLASRYNDNLEIQKYDTIKSNQKKRLDFVRVTRINELRRVSTFLQKDQAKVQELIDTERALSEAQMLMESLKSKSSEGAPNEST